MKNTVLMLFYILSTIHLLNAQTVICPNPGCLCEGSLTEMQLYFFGTDNTTIDVYSDQNQTNLLSSFAGVMSGDLITVTAIGSPNGVFSAYLYFRVTNPESGEVCTTRIYSQCPRNAWPGALDDLQVLGETFGDFTVFAYTSSGNNEQCTIADLDQDWHVGGNIVAAENRRFGTRNNESVSLITNDIERGVISDEGDFGFGTSAPELKLDVNVSTTDNLSNGNGIRVTTSTSDGGLRLRNNNGGEDYFIYSTGIGSINARGNLAFGRFNQVADMVLTRDGNVGIGTTITSGGVKLHVIGDRIRFSNGISRSLDFRTDNSEGIEINALGDHLNIHSPNNRNVLINNGLSDGDVGIGTASPQEKLHVEGDGIRLSTASSGRFLDFRTDGAGLGINSVNDDLFIRSLGLNNVFINSQPGDGKVGIGTTNLPNTIGEANISNYNLYVCGGILTEELRVSTTWCDYVFKPDYKLLALEKVEEHILEYGYLHNTPSEKEVVANGLSVGDAAVNQQEKIEEIFLHLIEMNKQLKELKAENDQLKAEINKLSQK